MKVIRDNIWLCEDCMLSAVNGDSPENENQARLTADGLQKLGPNLVSSFDCDTMQGMIYHSSMPCDCCGNRLHGNRYKFAILGKDEKPNKVYLSRVRLDSQGYTKSGKYFGVGMPLYRADLDDKSIYVRAETREKAKAAIRELHKDARFFK